VGGIVGYAELFLWSYYFMGNVTGGRTLGGADRIGDAFYHSRQVAYKVVMKVSEVYRCRHCNYYKSRTANLPQPNHMEVISYQ